MGYEVILISGPVAIIPPAGAKIINVTSAADMASAVHQYAPESDVVIMTAAVADYRPVHPFDSKMKKLPGKLVLELERTENYGAAIMKYYDLQEGDLLIIFHNIGINAATIDAAMEAKKAGAKIIAVSSSHWQEEMAPDHFIRHSSKKNLFDFADVCIDDDNPVGDAVVEIPGFDSPIAPISNVVDFTIAHWLEIECVHECVRRGITPPVWRSANAPGGDEKNAAYLKKYKPLIKSL
jgi:uncharacterized phosphosugar-binding protein